MSIRAYKLIEIKTKQTPTFSWHNEEIWDLARQNDSGDILYFSIDIVENAFKEYKEELKTCKGDRAVEVAENITILKAIKKDIGNDQEVEYYTF